MACRAELPFFLPRRSASFTLNVDLIFVIGPKRVLGNQAYGASLVFNERRIRGLFGGRKPGRYELALSVFQNTFSGSAFRCRR